MSESFDPYYRWLGIPPQEQPPDHYRLLGIVRFEPNADVIETAADRQMAHLRSYQTGKHAELSQRLLNEISAAKLCLLDVKRKDAYDAALRQSQPPAEARRPPASARPPQRAKAAPDASIHAQFPSAPPLIAASPAATRGARAPFRGRAARKHLAPLIVVLAAGGFLVMGLMALVGAGMFASTSATLPGAKSSDATAAQTASAEAAPQFPRIRPGSGLPPPDVPPPTSKTPVSPPENPHTEVPPPPAASEAIDLLARDLQTLPRLCDAQGKPLGQTRVFPPDTSKLPLPDWLPEEYELRLAVSLNVPDGGIYFLLNWQGKLLTHGVPFQEVPPGTVRDFTVTISKAGALFRERGELVRELSSRDLSALKDFPHPHSMLTEAAACQQVQLHALVVRPLAGSRGLAPPALELSTTAVDVPAPPRVAAAGSTRTLNLLAQTDPARDARRGPWSLSGGRLLVAASPAQSQLVVAHAPAGEYVLELSMTRISGVEPLRITFPIRGRPCTLIVDGWGGAGCGLALGYDPSPRGAYLARGESALFTGKPGKISVAVRRERIVVQVDGRTLFDLPGDPRWTMPLAPVQGALQLDVGPQTSYSFDAISITEFGS